MIFFATLVINILLLYYVLFGLKKHLHKLEIFAYWCAASILFQNISAILYLQFHRFNLSDVKSLNWADTLNRTILLPLLIVWFLNLYEGANSVKTKLILVFVFLNILCGVEWMSDWAGLFKHEDWKFWWSYALKLSVLFIFIGFMKLVQFIFFRKDSSNEFYI